MLYSVYIKSFENIFFFKNDPDPSFLGPKFPDPHFIEFTKTFIIHEIDTPLQKAVV